MEKEKIKNAVRFFYDLQELRMQSSNRAQKKSKAIALDEHDKTFMKKTGEGLAALEKEALKEVMRLIKHHPAWEYLKNVRGVGPTMAGVLISEIDINRCTTVSKLWAYCGLAVGPDGNAVRKKKGEKLRYNPWLKAKVLKVLGDSFIKSCSYDPEVGYCTSAVLRDGNGKQLTYVDKATGKQKKMMTKVPLPDGVVPYRKYYDDKKHRRENQRVDKCQACDGKGRVVRVARNEETIPGQKKTRNTIECPNCQGGKVKPLWGASQDHRHKDAVRVMVKQFLLDLWVYWRTAEGLEVRPSYAEEKLGIKHSKSA